MRISLKHLAIGMSLGAVFVFFYGFIKLKPQNQEQVQTAPNLVSQKAVDFNEIIGQKITLTTNADMQTQIQFIELNKYKSELPEVITPNPSPTPNPTPKVIKPAQVAAIQTVNNRQTRTINAPEEVISLIEKYASEYGVNKDMMIGIAKCESGFRSEAVNGPYGGIYQFVSGTWISNRRAMGLDTNLDLRYNAEESVKTAAFKMSRDGFGAWPVCQHKAKNLLVVNSESI